MPKPFCLVADAAEKLKKAILDGKISPEKLNSLKSSDRRKLFESIVGKDNAKEVNLLVEKKMLLKNQEQGIINAFRELLGDKAYLKNKEAIAKKLQSTLAAKREKIFGDSGLYNDVASDILSRKYNITVSDEEIKHITELAKTTENLKVKIKPEMPNGSKERIAYGLQKVMYDKYIANLKKEAKRLKFKEWFAPRNYGRAFYNIVGSAKGILASLDNSFFGTQGYKVLATKPGIWMKNFYKSFGDIGRQLFSKESKWYKSGDDAVLDLIKADAYSRKNALNGKYKAMGIDIGIQGEEAFPTALPERIPVLGRLYKASETAFNGAAIRMRTDLADTYIKWAEKLGIDMTNKEEAEGFGHIVNSMTGRGSLGKAESIGKEINVALFSGKFLKSNFDTLLFHTFDKKVKGAAYKLATKNILNIMAVFAGTAVVAKSLGFGVEIEPRGSNFMSIIINGHKVNVTGKLASLATLISRIVPTVHNGQLGMWSKNSNTGVWYQTNKPEYGQRNTLDVFNSFIDNKVSPFLGMIRDVWKGQTMSGDPVTFENETKSLITPLPIQNAQQYAENGDGWRAVTWNILTSLGFDTNTTFYPKNWELNISDELQKFKDSVGQKEFKKANTDYNKLVNNKLKELISTTGYKNMNDEQKLKELTSIREEAKKQIFKEYNYNNSVPKNKQKEKSRSTTRKTKR